MPRTTRVGDQWKSCDRCEILTPLSRLVIIDGLALCDRRGCIDDPLQKDEMHQRLVGEILSDGAQTEGTDRRADLYFAPSDWDNV